MSDDFATIQIVYIPDEKVNGIILELNLGWCLVEYTKYGILHQEVFDLDDIVLLKEYEVPLNREVDE